ncbi:MAG TPA: DUF1015 family protein [Vicinamibacterales bacterium]|nr:DUF1015 family protein [Vicinamibacterales bacterium]
MASIFPFAALRPAPSAAAAVAAVPYDVVSTDEARTSAAGNPLSFLHVSRAEIDLPPGTDPYSDAVYQRAAENFRDLRARAPLVEEDAPAFYVYRLEMGGHVQTGIAACFSLDEYDKNLIRKHERTRPEKEDDRTRHMLAISAQTGPVFLTYAASTAIDDVVHRTASGEPLFDFVAPDGIRHAIWTVDPADQAAVVAGFEALPALYIADGHHRAASAARARRALAGRGPGEHDHLMAVAFPDDQVQILPYNRVVKDLQGMTEARFVEAVGARATVLEHSQDVAARRGHAAMYVGSRWYALELDASALEGDAASTLDVAVLQRTVLEPVLGIQDVRTDKRIDFVGGIRGTAELERLVDSGAWAVAFALHPVAVRDLMDIADAGGIMPPKSTWFEPKLRDGLLCHLI